MRTHATKQKMSAKKRAAMIAAFVLAAALLLGGAFAWTDLAQSFTNRIRGGASPDVLLHDDFSPLENKDVYVENPGDQPIIVRVSFAEFFQIADTVYTLNPHPLALPGTPSDIDDKATWPVHIFPAPPPYPGILGTGTAGEFDGACTSGGPSEPIHDYFAWTMSGDQKWYKKGTSAFGDFDYTPDGELNPQTGAIGTYPADMVSGTGPAPGATYSDVALTLGDTPVVTMAYYLNYTAPLRLDYPDGFWILDVDGWCYWSELLMPDTATSLLLDNVTLRDPDVKPGDNYAYFIDVRLQACNRYEVEDLIAKGGTITGDGEDLLRLIATGVASNPFALSLIYEISPMVIRIRELMDQATASTMFGPDFNALASESNMILDIVDGILDQAELDGYGPFPELRGLLADVRQAIQDAVDSIGTPAMVEGYINDAAALAYDASIEILAILAGIGYIL